MKKINVPFALGNGGTTRGRKGGCFSCPAPLSPGLEAGLEIKLGSQEVQSTTRHPLPKPVIRNRQRARDEIN